MAGFSIAPDDLTTEDVLALLSLHLERMHKWSPADKVHALPPEKLRSPGVSFFAARASGELAAVGALKALGVGSGEIKSMRAADAWRGRGAGKAILLALLSEARARGYAWVGLETGKHPEFESAHRLYAAHGFRECPPFGDYVSDDFSLCMRLNLDCAPCWQVFAQDLRQEFGFQQMGHPGTGSRSKPVRQWRVIASPQSACHSCSGEDGDQRRTAGGGNRRFCA